MNTHPLDDPFHIYPAIVRNIVDGDTIDVDIDLGLKIWAHNVRIRLWGINAPEKRIKKDGKTVTNPEGVVTTDYLRKLILGQRIVIKTIKNKKGEDKTGSFGRYLAIVFYDGENINEKMVDMGIASPYRR